MPNTLTETWLNILFHILVRLTSEKGIQGVDVTKDSIEFRDKGKTIIITIKEK